MKRPTNMTLRELVRWIRKNKIVKTPKGCWEWQGSVRKSGYGTIRHEGKVHKVHRLMKLAKEGLDLDHHLQVNHHCDNPKCCRPAHTYLGTQIDNINDREERGRGVVPDNAKLDDKMRNDIRELYKQGGHSHRSLASVFGVSHTTIGETLRT